MRRTQISLWASQGRRGAAAAQEAIDNLDDAIAATQLGITGASLGIGKAIGGGAGDATKAVEEGAEKAGKAFKKLFGK